jgi:hypothetical protein
MASSSSSASTSSAARYLAPMPTPGSNAFFAPSAVEHAHMFHQHPTLAIASRVTLQSAGVGLLVSAVQNALDKCVEGYVWNAARVPVARIARARRTMPRARCCRYRRCSCGQLPRLAHTDSRHC